MHLRQAALSRLLCTPATDTRRQGRKPVDSGVVSRLRASSSGHSNVAMEPNPAIQRVIPRSVRLLTGSSKFSPQASTLSCCSPSAIPLRLSLSLSRSRSLTLTCTLAITDTCTNKNTHLISSALAPRSLLSPAACSVCLRAQWSSWTQLSHAMGASAPPHKPPPCLVPNMDNLIISARIRVTAWNSKLAKSLLRTCSCLLRTSPRQTSWDQKLL